LSLSTLLALLGLPLVAGGLVGLLDGWVAALQGRDPSPSLGLFLYSASLGATLAFTALLPFVGVMAVGGRPRSNARRLGLALAVLLLLPAFLLLA
jgi:hypothetical protein